MAVAMDRRLNGDGIEDKLLEVDVNSTHGKRRTKMIQNRLTKCGVLIATSAIASSMVGCAATAKSVISGRVIAGLAGQSVGASSKDERFGDPGIPGAKVSILSKNGSSSRGRGVYASVTSDEFGNFELSFANGQYPRDAVQVRVEGDGFFTSRSQTFLPKDGDRLLCVVITRPGYVIPTPPEDEQKK